MKTFFGGHCFKSFCFFKPELFSILTSTLKSLVSYRYMRYAGLLEYGSRTDLMGVTAGDTNRELTGLPCRTEEKNKVRRKIDKNQKRLKMLRRFSTLLIQQHHDAVAVGVAVEMSGDDVAVLPADGH